MARGDWLDRRPWVILCNEDDEDIAYPIEINLNELLVIISNH